MAPEKEIIGQVKFFEKLGLDKEIQFTDYTDGTYRGTLFEFKRSIDNISRVLSQAIKYLSRMRIKGENIPAHILLVDLAREKVYCFDSNDFLFDIEKTYIGAASRNNDNFTTTVKPIEISYSNINGIKQLVDIILDEKYTRIHIDENCVIGWAERFYNENPHALKPKMYEELRHPKVFADFIYPWQGNEEDFRYITDCLNDRQHKKELGAFFTPNEYCRISADMVRRAISEIPPGHDYIILDRCAGTGNLEQYFNDEELSHCIVATYELKEWQVLNYLIGDKVRCIIPPVDDRLGRPRMEQEDLFSINGEKRGNGLLVGADAMSVDVFDELREYVNNPQCNIIMLENPPYRDSSASNDKVKNVKSKSSFVQTAFKKAGTNQASHRDISNLFIWSAWKYYLKKSDDQFILYSPVKYWKLSGLGDKVFKEGYLFNRKHFHATASAIACIRWKNDYQNREKIVLKAVDIIMVGNGMRAVDFHDVEIKKVHTQMQPAYKDKAIYTNDIKGGCFVDTSGYPSVKKTEKLPVYNENIVGYLRASSHDLDAKSLTLTRLITYDALTQSIGFYLRDDNYITKLPLFCAKLYPQENWYERDIYFTAADRGDDYVSDSNFLRKCLIFTCLSQRNKCLSFIGSDDRFYRNELCFDNDTLAIQDLRKMQLDSADNKILGLWKSVLECAKQTDEYNPQYTYGLWQIESELNVWEYNGDIYTELQRKEKNKECKNRGKSEPEMLRRYVSLNTAINELKVGLKEYYKTQIQDKLFLYELLK